LLNRQNEVKDKQFHNILVVRTDRIGDVVLSLPMITALRNCFPAARRSMLLRTYTREIADGYQGLDSIVLYDEGGREKQFFAMLSELRTERFDAVVVSYPTFRLALLVFFAGIPLRVGTGYRWYSLFFNRKVYEHRRTAEKHELEYNLSLLKVLGCSPGGKPSIALLVPGWAVERAREERRGLGIADDEVVVVLHPGSGGSARDWSPEHFGGLARILSDKGYRVVVTGTRNEEQLVRTVVQKSGNTAIPLRRELTLLELSGFLQLAGLVVANSTGPLHIAAAVGTPVIGLYPPIPECSPKRWGPWTEKSMVFVADRQSCPRCKGGPCQGNDCMEQIAEKDVAEGALRLLHGTKEKAVSNL
jgi:ADP-heptose:LPS heptosyltransferase